MKQKYKEYLNPEFVRKRQVILDFVSLRIINASELLKSIDISPTFFSSRRERDLRCMKMSHLDKFVAGIVYCRNILQPLIQKDVSMENAISIVKILDKHKVFIKQIWGRNDMRVNYIKAKITKGVNLSDNDISIIFTKTLCLEKCINTFLRDIENTAVSNFNYNVPTYQKRERSIEQGNKQMLSSATIKNNIEEIISRRAKGESIKDIAHLYNVSTSTIYKNIKKYNNNTLFSKGKELVKDKLVANMSSILERLDKDETLLSVANNYNVTPNYLGIIIKRYKNSLQLFPAKSINAIDEREKLGSKLFLLREKSGLSQSDLADIVNIDARYISEIERGVLNPKLDIFIKIVKALGKNIDIID